MLYNTLHIALHWPISEILWVFFCIFSENARKCVHFHENAHISVKMCAFLWKCAHFHQNVLIYVGNLHLPTRVIFFFLLYLSINRRQIQQTISRFSNQLQIQRNICVKSIHLWGLRMLLYLRINYSRERTWRKRQIHTPL